MRTANLGAVVDLAVIRAFPPEPLRAVAAAPLDLLQADEMNVATSADPSTRELHELLLRNLDLVRTGVVIADGADLSHRSRTTPKHTSRAPWHCGCQAEMASAQASCMAR